MGSLVKSGASVAGRGSRRPTSICCARRRGVPTPTLWQDRVRPGSGLRRALGGGPEFLDRDSVTGHGLHCRWPRADAKAMPPGAASAPHVTVTVETVRCPPSGAAGERGGPNRQTVVATPQGRPNLALGLACLPAAPRTGRFGGRVAEDVVLAEQDDEWQDGRRSFRPETMAAINAVIEHEEVNPTLLMAN